MRSKFYALAAAAVALAALATPAQAARVILRSSVFVERAEQLGQGTSVRTVSKATTVAPGDRLVYQLNWRRDEQASEGFTVTTPLPRHVSYQRSADGREEVSADGGRTWGRLGQLRVRDADGRMRDALPEDVTHVRWQVPRQIALAGEGRIIYSAIVH